MFNIINKHIHFLNLIKNLKSLMKYFVIDKDPKMHSPIKIQKI